MPKLVVSLPDAGEVIHELTEAQLIVGRTDDNSLQIEDASVSTHHAELTLSGTGYLLKDLGSTNGTRINGELLHGERRLQHGSRITFGKVEAVYEADGQSAAQPLPSEEAAPVSVAATSQRPQNFGNASPFQRKRVKSNPMDMVAIALFVIAIITFAAAAFLSFQLKAPVS